VSILTRRGQIGDQAVELGKNAAVNRIVTGRPYDFATAKAHALFLGWTEAFRPVLESHDVLAVESEFQFPLLNPETEAPSRTFVEAGKVDGLLRDRRSGQQKVLEHKTTAGGIEPESDYWLRLRMDTQVSKYILAERSKGNYVNSVLYDVVRKPAHRPLQIGLVDDDGVKIVFDDNGQRVRTKDGRKWRESSDTAQGFELQTREETPLEYHKRILAELSSDPVKYFSQREIPRLDSEVLEYMGDAWAVGQQILYYRNAGIWPRNPSACTEFGGCEYFGLCSGRASVDGITFRPKPNRHSELQIVESDKSFLTNSRMSALHKCSRYHFLRYEQPVERVAEESEALRVGTLFHLAVETYLESFIAQ
jgi:hypothetical protein